MNVVGRLEKFLTAIKLILMAAIDSLGPFVVAAIPASFMAFTTFRVFYHTENDFWWWVAGWFALVVAVGIEVLGVYLCSVATELYDSYNKGLSDIWQLRVALLLVPIYTLGVDAVIWWGDRDAFHPLVVGMGMASSWFATAMYVALALSTAARRSEISQEALGEKVEAEQKEEIKYERQQKEEDKAWRRQLKLKKLEMEQELKLAELEAGKPAEPAGKLPEKNEGAGKLPEWLPEAPRNKRQFVEQVRSGAIDLPDNITSSDLAEYLPVGERATRNWIREARNGH